MRLALPLVLVACAAEGPADGSIAVSVYGEEYIEQGIPAELFTDGWSVRFDHVVVSVADLRIASGSTAALSQSGPAIFDLVTASEGAGQAFLKGPAAGGDWPDVSFRIAAPTAVGTLGNAAQAQREALVNGKYAVWVAGTATKGDEQRRFTWGFTGATRYSPCPGAALSVDGAEAPLQLTIHADHLFYDHLASETPNVRFQAIADADANDDGEVTAEELAAVELAGLSDYQTGNLRLDTLWDYVSAAVTTVGHVQGEGHCEATVE